MHGVEILIDAPMATRGRRMLQALADTAPAGGMISRSYIGTRRVLVMYGAAGCGWVIGVRAPSPLMTKATMSRASMPPPSGDQSTVP